MKIITEMINRSRVNISNSSFHLLFWGWLIMICGLSEFILYRFTDFGSPWYVWFFVIPGVFVSFIYGFSRGKKATVHTYADGLYMWVWIAFFIASLVLFVINYHHMVNVSKYILVLAGIPTFISGAVLKFRPLMLGGIAIWLFALAAHFGGDTVSALSVPAAVLTGYLIPGYLLRRRGRHDAV